MVVLILLVEFLYAVIARGILASGLAASLGRLKHGEPVTGDTFLRDVVRYFRPVAGVCVIVLALPYALYLPSIIAGSTPGLAGTMRTIGVVGMTLWKVIVLVLVFSPYAAVFWGSGSWAAVKRGAGDWLRTAWTSVSFVALGLALATVVLGLLDLVREYLVRETWLYLLFRILESGIRTALTVLIAIAVWELYWQITEKASVDTP